MLANNYPQTKEKESNVTKKKHIFTGLVYINKINIYKIFFVEKSRLI